MLNVVKGVTYGCDPELFFQHSGRIIGAEKVIPTEGLQSKRAYSPDVVLDGVQVELNPCATQTPQLLGAYISSAFQLLRGHLKTSSSVRDWCL